MVFFSRNRSFLFRFLLFLGWFLQGSFFLTRSNHLSLSLSLSLSRWKPDLERGCVSVCVWVRTWVCVSVCVCVRVCSMMMTSCRSGGDTFFFFIIFFFFFSFFNGRRATIHRRVVARKRMTKERDGERERERERENEKGNDVSWDRTRFELFGLFQIRCQSQKPSINPVTRGMTTGISFDVLKNKKKKQFKKIRYNSVKKKVTSSFDELESIKRGLLFFGFRVLIQGSKEKQVKPSKNPVKLGTKCCSAFRGLPNRPNPVKPWKPEPVRTSFPKVKKAPTFHSETFFVVVSEWT